MESGTLQTPLDTATYEGKLYGAPDNTNVQLLWYRSDLVPTPPKTWDEMISMAEALVAEGKPGRIVGQGKQYEGLVCNMMEYILSNGGALWDETRMVSALDRPAHVGVRERSLGPALHGDP